VEALLLESLLRCRVHREEEGGAPHLLLPAACLSAAQRAEELFHRDPA
jgi:hypothetical protein